MKKITLIQKLVASYAAISFFSLAALAISYSGLYSLNKIARDIVTNDFALINAANGLRESVLAQQSYAAKFVILKGAEFRDLYLQRETESEEILRKLKGRKHPPLLDDISVSYRDFQNTAHRLFQGDPEAPRVLKPAAEKVVDLLDKALAERQLLLGKKLESAEERERSTIGWTLLLSLAGFLLAVGTAALLVYRISTAVAKLKRATHRIAAGEFDFDPDIPPGDEVGDLAQDFTRMAKRLKELEQISLDASPLTRLPGNIAIEQMIERKLEEGKPFAVCYADLDNFKAYNDRYGYIKGSEMIKTTGEIIYDTVSALDSQDAFVGHVGGDDFVMAVLPEKAAQVCESVIDKFDRTIPAFYSPEDRAAGAIEGADRYGVHRRFPLMTISIAVVICQKGAYDSAVSIAKAAAEMKDNLKGKAGSNYSFNRRLQPR
ncbi:MAG TPA: diguanylate cyclase [Geobacteraceae bacterium]